MSADPGAKAIFAPDGRLLAGWVGGGCAQARVGELAAETWNAQHATLRRIASTKGFQWFWANYAQEFGASFQRVVAELERRGS